MYAEESPSAFPPDLRDYAAEQDAAELVELRKVVAAQQNSLAASERALAASQERCMASDLARAQAEAAIARERTAMLEAQLASLRQSHGLQGAPFGQSPGPVVHFVKAPDPSKVIAHNLEHSVDADFIADNQLGDDSSVSELDRLFDRLVRIVGSSSGADTYHSYVQHLYQLPSAQGVLPADPGSDRALAVEELRRLTVDDSDGSVGRRSPTSDDAVSESGSASSGVSRASLPHIFRSQDSLLAFYRLERFVAGSGDGRRKLTAPWFALDQGLLRAFKLLIVDGTLMSKFRNHYDTFAGLFQAVLRHCGHSAAGEMRRQIAVMIGPPGHPVEGPRTPYHQIVAALFHDIQARARALQSVAEQKYVFAVMAAREFGPQLTGVKKERMDRLLDRLQQRAAGMTDATLAAELARELGRTGDAELAGSVTASEVQFFDFRSSPLSGGGGAGGGGCHARRSFKRQEDPELEEYRWQRRRGCRPRAKRCRSSALWVGSGIRILTVERSSSGWTFDVSGWVCLPCSWDHRWVCQLAYRAGNAGEAGGHGPGLGVA